MRKPSKKKVTEFLNAKFPHIEFDGIKFEETDNDRCWFKVISYGRMIAQADYELNDRFWTRVEGHLKWALN
jgi:hypothetical protein